MSEEVWFEEVAPKVHRVLNLQLQLFPQCIGRHSPYANDASYDDRCLLAIFF
jgi:hypothetical protein